VFIPSTIHDLKARHEAILSNLKHNFIPEVIEILKNDVNAIILYGSHARGNYNWQSDTDLIIVSNQFEGIRKLDRTRLFDNVNSIVNVEIVCYTCNEFETGLNSGNLTILEALDYGKILYDQNNFFFHSKTLFNKLLANGLIRKVTIAGETLWKISDF
jgi:predicted nucleotidyltransferase